MQLADLVLIASVLGVVVLVVACAYNIVRNRQRQALHVLAVAVAWSAGYVAALVGVGLASSEEHLAVGKAKCFDEWCVAVTHVRAAADGYTVSLEITNRGHHPQRPDRPHASVIIDGQASPIAVAGLDDQVRPEIATRLTLPIEVPRAAGTAALLVTEGGGPSALVIGDENSPFHARSIWPLRWK
jgi:hypothetical protein